MSDYDTSETRIEELTREATQPIRTVQDLLAERRATINELRRETDKTAREMLAVNVLELDAAIERARADEGDDDSWEREPLCNLIDNEVE